MIALLFALLDAPQMRLVVFEMQSGALRPADQTAIDAHGLSAAVREVALDEVPGVTVMAMEEVNRLLEANGEDLARCEKLCVAQLGQKVSADYAVGGRLYRTGKLLKLSLELWGTKDSAQLSGATAEGATPEDLERDVRVKAQKLFRPLKHEAAVVDGRITAAETAPAPAAAPPVVVQLETEPAGAVVLVDDAL